jgi:hypothetical protein
LELIVNGAVAERKEIVADGSLHDLTFDVPLEQSSWIAVRVFPSCHTNPIFVEVAGQPIRARKASGVWCRDAVDVCWKAKMNQIRPAERDAAKAAYDAAKGYYEKVIGESR